MLRSERSQRLAMLAAMCGVAVGAAGCGGTDQGAAPVPLPIVTTPNTSSYVDARTTYPALDPTAAITSVMRGLDEDVVTKLRLGAPQGSGSSGLWLYTTVRAPSKADALHSEWEAYLAQGAIAEHLAAAEGTQDLSQAVSGSQQTLLLPDGSTVDLGGGAGFIAAGQEFAAQTQDMSDADILASVKTALAPFHFQKTSVQVVRPLGPAVSVVAQTDDVTTLRGQWEAIRSAILGDPDRYEGFYFELDDTHGTALARVLGASRVGTGHIWFAPGMDDLLGITHGHTAPPVTKTASS